MDDPSQLPAPNCSPLCFHRCGTLPAHRGGRGAFQDLFGEGSGSRGHENTWAVLTRSGESHGKTWGKPYESYEVMKLSRIFAKVII